MTSIIIIPHAHAKRGIGGRTATFVLLGGIPKIPKLKDRKVIVKPTPLPTNKTTIKKKKKQSRQIVKLHHRNRFLDSFSPDSHPPAPSL